MKLFEIRKLEPTWQMIMSFSNNNDVVITEADMDPNSVFCRRSRIRMLVEFEKVLEAKELMVFRTFRKNSSIDYFVTLSRSYKVIEHQRKLYAYKHNMELSDAEQMSIKDIIAPNLNRIADVYLDCESNQWKLHHQELSEDYTSVSYEAKCPYWAKPYGLVMQSAKLLIDEKQCDKFDVLRYHIKKDQIALSKLISGDWIARNKYTRAYASVMKDMKNKFDKNKVSLVFIIDQ